MRSCEEMYVCHIKLSKDPDKCKVSLPAVHSHDGGKSTVTSIIGLQMSIERQIMFSQKIIDEESQQNIPRIEIKCIAFMQFFACAACYRYSDASVAEARAVFTS